MLEAACKLAQSSSAAEAGPPAWLAHELDLMRQLPTTYVRRTSLEAHYRLSCPGYSLENLTYHLRGCYGLDCLSPSFLWPFTLLVQLVQPCTSCDGLSTCMHAHKQAASFRWPLWAMELLRLMHIQPPGQAPAYLCLRVVRLSPPLPQLASSLEQALQQPPPTTSVRARMLCVSSKCPSMRGGFHV